VSAFIPRLKPWDESEQLKINKINQHFLSKYIIFKIDNNCSSRLKVLVELKKVIIYSNLLASN